MAKTRFDMEQEIMDCWHVTDDIDVLMEAVMEKDASKDTIVNVLLGMKVLYQMKFERLFDTFEQCIRDGHFEKVPEHFGIPKGDPFEQMYRDAS